jgi:YD repeat-containing protein
VPTDTPNPDPAGGPARPWETTYACEYDADGRLVRVSALPGAVEITAYDGDGRRIGPADPPGVAPQDRGPGEEPPDEPFVVG